MNTQKRRATFCRERKFIFAENNISHASLFFFFFLCFLSVPKKSTEKVLFEEKNFEPHPYFTSSYWISRFAKDTFRGGKKVSRLGLQKTTTFEYLVFFEAENGQKSSTKVISL